MAASRMQEETRAGPSSGDSGIEILLLDVLYDHLRLETALSALQDAKGRRFLPLRQLGKALGYRLHVDAVKRTAGGFLADPTDRFAVNGRTGRCVHRGWNMEFDPALCFERDGEFYLDSDLVARFCGIHFEWRMSKLEMDVTSDIPLPIQQQWMRRQILDHQKPPEIAPALPSIRTPFRLWSLPWLDMQWYSDANVDQKVTQSASRAQIEGRGDLLFMSARYRFISASGKKPASAFLTLGRVDPHAGLAGPLRATQFSFGDLNLPQVPLFARSRNGLGITLSNLTLPGMQSTAMPVLDGRALPGSTVELYRGSELLGSVRADPQGEFEFSVVPLESGPNELRVVIVTPDGDVTEERRTLYGDSAGPPTGSSQYRLTAARVGDSLLPHSADSLADDQKRIEYVGEFRFGLSDSSWLSTIAATSQGEGFLGVGLHSWEGGSLWHLDTMLSGNGGSAVSAGISRRVGRATFSLEHTFASPAFASELVPEFGSPATSVTRLRLDGSFGNVRNPYSYGIGVDRLNGPSPSTQIRARLSGSRGRTFFANTVALRLSGAPLDATGLLQFRRPLGESMGRLDIGYGLGSERVLQSIRTSFDRSISATFRLRYGLDYDSTRSGKYESFGTIYRALGPLELGVNLALDSHGALKTNLLLSLGIEGDEVGNRLAFARPGASETGSASIRVFLDKNYDGKYDEGDLLLNNIGFRIGGHATSVRTGKNGCCFIDRLASDQEVVVSLNDDSFEDPSWAPAAAGVQIFPRAGRVARLDFAVIEAAEIEGRVEGLHNQQDGLTAELVNFQGKVTDTSVLDTSATFVFSRVRPGDYKLRLVDAAGQVYGQRQLRIAPAASVRDCVLQISR